LHDFPEKRRSRVRAGHCFFSFLKDCGESAAKQKKVIAIENPSLVGRRPNEEAKRLDVRDKIPPRARLGGSERKRGIRRTGIRAQT
jgi:hypothetical protein